MIKILTYFLFLIFINEINSDNNKINFSQFKCKSSEHQNVEKGKEITLCIHFVSEEKNKRVAFRLIVDDYSVVAINDGLKLAENFLESTEDNVEQSLIVAQIGSVISSNQEVVYENKFKNDTGTKESEEINIFGLFNLVIKVEKGEIKDIAWDNGCFDCDSSLCSEVTSKNLKHQSILYDNCKEAKCDINNGINSCDPKFYITWFGTDVNGRRMKSSNLAMSKFKQYSIKSLYGSVKGIFSG